jgi:adenylate cyclase
MKPNLPVAVIVVALALGLLYAGLLARTHLNGTASVVDRFETVMLDLRIALVGPRRPPEEVVIVAIDDRTLDSVGPYPLPRDHLADLITRIRQAGARALAVDILLFGSSEDDKDGSLAKAMAELPSVTAGAAQMEEENAPSTALPVVRTMLAPAPAVAATTSVGLANIVTDTGGTPRHVPMLFLSPEGLQPSFSLLAAGKFQGEPATMTGKGLRFGPRSVPLDLGWHLALNYFGPSGSIATISAGDLLSSSTDHGDLLAGRMVVLGVTATAVGDRFSTPFDPVMPGVEVQATAIANLLDGNPLVRDAQTRMLDSAAALVLTLLGMLAVIFLPLAPASVFYLLLLAGWLALCTALFPKGIWLNVALPYAASLPPVVGLIITRQIADRIQSRRHLRAQEALSRFQSPRLARRIADDPSFLATPREQVAAILFVDLSGYTRLSEHLGPARTRDFLKEFHTLVVNVVTGDDGLVLDFMGDGAMLGFGIPDADRQDPLKAVRCAFHLHREISAWLRSSGRAEEISEVRVGAHTGPVVLSRLGHDSQQQIAATGDCVNVASRLLEVAKSRGAAVVVSADLLAAAKAVAGRETLAPRLETVMLRGRRRDLDVGLWTAGETKDAIR